jgi:hypothetical protein
VIPWVQLTAILGDEPDPGTRRAPPRPLIGRAAPAGSKPADRVTRPSLTPGDAADRAAAVGAARSDGSAGGLRAGSPSPGFPRVGFDELRSVMSDRHTPFRTLP